MCSSCVSLAWEFSTSTPRCYDREENGLIFRCRSGRGLVASSGYFGDPQQRSMKAVVPDVNVGAQSMSGKQRNPTRATQKHSRGKRWWTLFTTEDLLDTDML